MHIRHFFFNKALRILLITNAMILISAAMIAPIYALFVEKIGGDLLDASFAGGAMALAAGCTVLVSGRISDRVKRPEIIVSLGYIAMGVGFLLYTVVDSIWFLLCIQVLIGFGEALYSPPFDALYSRHLTVKKAGREWGAWESMNYFSIAIGAVLGGFIVTQFGFIMLFMIMAGMCFLSGFYIYFLPRHTL